MTSTSDKLVFFIIVATTLAVLIAMWSFNGHWPTDTSSYNTYAIQAQAWLNGQMHVADHSHLELAHFQGKTYVSFPPFPSVIMLPFVSIFGLSTPDHFIGLFFGLLGIFFTYKLLRNFLNSIPISLFLALFATLASNYLFLLQNGWVWFFAQTLAYTFTVMAFYFATASKRSFLLALLFLSFAVGCRPFQLIYAPIILIFMTRENLSIQQSIRSILPAVIVGVLYALYNYVRFGSIWEFGHNYLPEMTQSTYGQFSLHYLTANLQKLYSLPPIQNNGIVDYPHFNGFSIFLLNPFITLILLLLILYIIHFFISKDKKFDQIPLIVLGFVLIHTVVICMHITMGGWHWGNRYLIDTIPAFVLMLGMIAPKLNINWFYSIPLFAYGFTLNAIGTTLFYLR